MPRFCGDGLVLLVAEWFVNESIAKHAMLIDREAEEKSI